MAEDAPQLHISLDGAYSEFVTEQASTAELSATAVVERALALLAILGEAIAGCRQLVLQYLFEEQPEQLLRIDHYLPPAPSSRGRNNIVLLVSVGRANWLNRRGGDGIKGLLASRSTATTTKATKSRSATSTSPAPPTTPMMPAAS